MKNFLQWEGGSHGTEKKLAFTFAVIGDTHYINKKYHLNQIKKGIVEDMERYDWMRDHVTPSLFSEIKQHRPQFVVQLGDFVEGGCDNDDLFQCEMREALEQLSLIGAPVFISKGNHDFEAIYHQTVMPFLSKNLGRRLKKNYYSFVYNNSVFFIIDYLDFAAGNRQYEWLKRGLENYCSADHIFIFGHAPLFPIARPFFSERKFIGAMLKLLDRYYIDAYFCGHTHNQAVTLHRRKGGNILQIMGSTIGFPEKEPVSLEESRNLLFKKESCHYYWGFLEDSAPSYYLVRVGKNSVRIGWHLLQNGRQGLIEWEKRGDCKLIEQPLKRKEVRINHQDIGNISSAYLHMCFYNSKKSNKPVFLNGIKIGDAPIADAFIPRKGIKIPKDKLVYVRMINRIEIQNPQKELFCVGGVSLDVILYDGQKIRTNVSPYIYTTTKKWDDWRLDIVRHVEPGKTISIILKFHGISGT